jgi:ABC-2 type transport system permease protein
VLVGNLLLPLVVALVALVLGVNAFGDERDEGTRGLLLATTLARPRIVLAKRVAAVVVVWLASLALGTATRLGLGTIAWSLLVSSALAAAAYVALFTLLSLLLSRAVLLGFAYLVLWEGLLAVRRRRSATRLWGPTRTGSPARRGWTRRSRWRTRPWRPPW